MTSNKKTKKNTISYNLNVPKNMYFIIDRFINKKLINKSISKNKILKKELGINSKQFWNLLQASDTGEWKNFKQWYEEVTNGALINYKIGKTLSKKQVYYATLKLIKFGEKRNIKSKKGGSYKGNRGSAKGHSGPAKRKRGSAKGHSGPAKRKRGPAKGHSGSAKGKKIFKPITEQPKKEIQAAEAIYKYFDTEEMDKIVTDNEKIKEKLISLDKLISSLKRENIIKIIIHLLELKKSDDGTNYLNFITDIKFYSNTDKVSISIELKKQLYQLEKLSNPRFFPLLIKVLYINLFLLFKSIIKKEEHSTFLTYISDKTNEIYTILGLNASKEGEGDSTMPYLAING